MHCFKAHYHTKFIQRTVDLYKTSVTPSEIYDIDQLEAMRLAQDAWNEVDTMTIHNCWQKAGILPQANSELPSMTSDPTRPALPISSHIHPSLTDTTDDPIAHAEKLVTNALDDLVTVFNCEPHSGSGASKVSFWKRHFGTTSEFPMPFRTPKGQRYFSNDRNHFQKVLRPFQTWNRQKHFNHLTISYIRLNL